MENLEVEVMNVISTVASRLAPTLVISISQTMTQRQAYRLGDWFSSVAVRQGSLRIIRAIRSSLSVILGVPIDDPRIDQALVRFLKNIYCSYVDFFKALRGSREKIVDSIDLDPVGAKKIQDYLANGQSVVLVGVHTCGFDFGIVALTKWFPDIQVLGKKEPKGEFKLMHKMRLKFGLNITPLSVASLREAVQRLKNGGVVTIANDLPIENGDKFSFFGKKVCLTSGHARLALKTGAVMMMVVPHRVSPGRYRVVIEEVPRPESTGNRKLDAIRWAQKSYACLEKFIRRWPEEWFGLTYGMFMD